MSKKVLILSSSPRKGGNSDLLYDEFMKGAKESGHDVEKIFVANKKINYCAGCGDCYSSHKCVQNDDMADPNKNMLNRAVEALRGFTEDCLPGAVEKDIIYGTGAWKKGEIKNTSAFLQAYGMGKSL